MELISVATFMKINRSGDDNRGDSYTTAEKLFVIHILIRSTDDVAGPKRPTYDILRRGRRRNAECSSNWLNG